jgi:hypothetical protein
VRWVRRGPQWHSVIRRTRPWRNRGMGLGWLFCSDDAASRLTPSPCPVILACKRCLTLQNHAVVHDGQRQFEQAAAERSRTTHGLGHHVRRTSSPRWGWGSGFGAKHPRQCKWGQVDYYVQQHSASFAYRRAFT